MDMSTIIARGIPRKRRIGPPVEQQFNSRIRLCIISPTERGYFTGTVDGELLVTSKAPFCDVARVLLARGVDSNSWLVMRHAGSDVDSLRGKIGIIAKLTVRETETNDEAHRLEGLPKPRGSPAQAFNNSRLPMAASAAVV